MSILDELGERDWVRHPYSKAEFVDAVLKRYQRAGIDPFFALKPDELPSEGDDWKSKVFHKVIGNIVEGVPGMHVTDSGKVHWKNKHTKDTYDVDDVYTAANSTKTNLIYLTRAISELNPLMRGPSSTATNTLTDYNIHDANGALTAGQGTIPAYTPTGGQKFETFWNMLGTNLSAAVNQEYDVQLKEQDGAVFDHFKWMGTEAHRKIHAFYEGTTADKSFEVVIDGGSGTETIYVRTAGGSKT